jgi:hypothetical protein
MALTYHHMKDESQAYKLYMQCKDMCSSVKNSKLELGCLIKALDLRETMSVKTQRPNLAPTEQEYASAL